MVTITWPWLDEFVISNSEVATARLFNDYSPRAEKASNLSVYGQSRLAFATTYRFVLEIVVTDDRRALLLAQYRRWLDSRDEINGFVDAVKLVQDLEGDVFTPVSDTAARDVTSVLTPFTIDGYQFGSVGTPTLYGVLQLVEEISEGGDPSGVVPCTTVPSGLWRISFVLYENPGFEIPELQLYWQLRESNDLVLEPLALGVDNFDLYWEQKESSEVDGTLFGGLFTPTEKLDLYWQLNEGIDPSSFPGTGFFGVNATLELYWQLEEL
jgi:hypothetical protein